DEEQSSSGEKLAAELSTTPEVDVNEAKKKDYAEGVRVAFNARHVETEEDREKVLQGYADQVRKDGKVMQVGVIEQIDDPANPENKIWHARPDELGRGDIVLN